MLLEPLALFRQDPLPPGGRPSGPRGDEVRPVLVIPEEGAPLQAPHHDVVEDIRGIEARLAGHGEGGRSTEIVRMQRPAFQAYTTRWPCWHSAASRSAKSVRSVSVGKILVRSRPRPMTWCRVPGASRRGCLGMRGGYNFSPKFVKLF